MPFTARTYAISNSGTAMPQIFRLPAANTMSQHYSVYTTTYEYTHLLPRFIRLLELTPDDTDDTSNTPTYRYRIVHAELPLDGQAPSFDAISYTWGNPVKVATLQVHENGEHIALTANLTEALPSISQHSSTKRLWIDQLCINQSDNAEKSIQVGLMSEIYSRAANVIVWLGLEDDTTGLCKEWLSALNELLPSLPDANRIQHDSEDFHDAYRYLAVTGTFKNSTWDSRYQKAVGKFCSRLYFRRSWIVQEFLLARSLIILAGNTRFTVEELGDLYCVPVTEETRNTVDNWSSYRTLLPLKRWPHSGTQPLRFLRMMTTCAREFEASFYGDGLYSMTGMLEGLDFTPDYTQSTKHNFTRFATTIARDFGSLDFLGLCAAKLDTLIKDTPEEVQGFPSWVPSWTALPLETPWRLVVGGSNHYIGDISWNACAGRKHTSPQPQDPLTTSQLHVRGQIIDYVETISSTIIGAKHFDADTTYLDDLVTQLRQDLPSCCGAWTPVDLVDFLNGPILHGNEAQAFDAAEAILGSKPRFNTREELNTNSRNDALALRLVIGRGRRMAVTERGRLCLVPFVDSRARNGETRGSLIVVLHGCIVPLVLNCEDEERREYKIVGEAYAKDIMHGEAVRWEENEAEEFVLM